MESVFHVEVEGGRTSVIFSIFRMLAAVVVLAASLLLYLAGLILTLSIVGSIIGLPIMAATYAIDMVALLALIKVREKIHIVPCPRCSKKRFLITSVKDRFYCKRCKSYIHVYESSQCCK